MTETRCLTLFFTVWLLGMGVMASQIERHLSGGQAEGHSKDPLYLLLGSAKEAIGDTFFLKASSYFHGGVDTDLIQHEDAFGSGQEHEGEETPHESFKKSTTDWVYQINSQVKVMEHRHLKDEETKEILPFLKTAVAFDPYNVSALLTTAYWLNNYFKKTDAAIEVLSRGLKDNPDSWEIPYHLGMNYFKYKKDYAQSSAYFTQCLKKMSSESSTVIDRRTAYYYLAESCMRQGLKKEANEAYRKALGYFNESENLPLKFRILEKIKTNSL